MIIEPIVVPPGHRLKVILNLPNETDETLRYLYEGVRNWIVDGSNTALLLNSDNCTVSAFLIPDGVSVVGKVSNDGCAPESDLPHPLVVGG